MWVSGIMEGLMWSATNEAGTTLKYGNFVTITQAKHIMLLFRAFGGTLYLTGFLMLAINIFKTVRMGKAVDATAEVPEVAPSETDSASGFGLLFRNDPITYTFWVIAFVILWLFLPQGMDIGALVIAGGLTLQAIWGFSRNPGRWGQLYDSLEKNWIPFTLLVLLATALGGAVQIIPTIIAQKGKHMDDRVQVLYTPLELAGRDIYIKEGCYNCHSQQIRKLEGDIMRYGKSYLKDKDGTPLEGGYSRIGETIYDHPFQWGSKRTGPDLAREGRLRPDIWHYNHMINPRSTSDGSIMPAYPWLLDTKTDIKALPKKIAVLAQLGVPYDETMSKDVIIDKAKFQALKISRDLLAADEIILPDDIEKIDDDTEIVGALAEREIIALIAYLQKLGAYEVVKDKKAGVPVMVDPDKKHTNRETPAE